MFLTEERGGAEGAWCAAPAPIQVHALPLWLSDLFLSSAPTPLAPPEAESPQTLLSLCLDTLASSCAPKTLYLNLKTRHRRHLTPKLSLTPQLLPGLLDPGRDAVTSSQPQGIPADDT